jgi:hypothetical protein
MAVGTNTGKIMVCCPTGVLSVLDISPASSRQGMPGGGTDAAAADELTPTAGSRSRSGNGAVQSNSLSAAASPASTPKRGKSSIAAPWLDAPGDASKASTPALGQYAVQAVVQRGRGFVAAGSMGDVYLFAPGGGKG